MLASTDYSISPQDHIKAVFNCLIREYDTFIVFMNSHNGEYFVVEIESLLLAHEAQIKKGAKELDSRLSMVNFA